MSSKLYQLVLYYRALFIQSWRPLANYGCSLHHRKCECDWQVTLCDPHLSALEVRFSRRCAIQIDVYLYLYLWLYTQANRIQKWWCTTVLTHSHPTRRRSLRRLFLSYVDPRTDVGHSLQTATDVVEVVEWGQFSNGGRLSPTPLARS